MYKAFKYQILPTEAQKTLLNQHFGCRRFVYNFFLNRRKEEYTNNTKNLTYKLCSAELTKLKEKEEYSWLNNVSAQSLQHALRDLDGAYNRFFRKESMFPNFKKKSNKQSFRIPQRVLVDDNNIYIPKFRDGIKINIHRPFGKIKFATFSKTPTGKYFVSLTCEIEKSTFLPKTTKTIGIDLGIKNLLATSEGDSIPNVQTYKQLEGEIKYKLRQLSKKKKGSKSKDRARMSLARTHEHIKNIRYNHLHQTSRKLINENQVICVESLAVKDMMSNHSGLAKQIANCGWNELLRQLKYKAEWYGRKIVEVDRYFPSSKLCSKCGYIKTNLTLADRQWHCSKCGAIHDRDTNAAINIHKQGLNILSGSGIESDTKQKRAEALQKGGKKLQKRKVSGVSSRKSKKPESIHSSGNGISQ